MVDGPPSFASITITANSSSAPGYVAPNMFNIALNMANLGADVVGAVGTSGIALAANLAQIANGAVTAAEDLTTLLNLPAAEQIAIWQRYAQAGIVPANVYMERSPSGAWQFLQFENMIPGNPQFQLNMTPGGPVVNFY